MNKRKAPNIPPILSKDSFILNCKEKANIFINFFSNQCKLVINDSNLPNFSYLTEERIDHMHVENKDIISLIRKLNPNKANGPDGISGQMLLLCDETIIVPLGIIFNNIVSIGIYPDMWKCANVTPVFKKGDKQLIKNYRPISLLPICGKILEKVIFDKLYKHFVTHNLITKKPQIN